MLSETAATTCCSMEGSALFRGRLMHGAPLCRAATARLGRLSLICWRHHRRPSWTLNLLASPQAP
eukprot:2679773-Amphidinium_carterae.8